MKKQIANIITTGRILCAIFLLFCPVFSVAFYVLYLFCGFSDMVDGMVARKTMSFSGFGAKLDTVADVVFIAVCFAKILPLMSFPIWLWIWIAVIVIIKFSNILYGFICFKQLISLHTFSNKAMGFLLFLYPLTLGFIEPIFPSATVCFFAMLTALKETYDIKNLVVQNDRNFL